MSSDGTSLGDRMKELESWTRQVLPRRVWTILRVDGRAFHTYLRDAQKPFDYQFISDMSKVAEALCAEVSGTVFAYHQSDEISLLLQDFERASTQPWFGGVVQKMSSVAASIATQKFNEVRPGKPAMFDARVFTLSQRSLVYDYFVWRQRDAVRNSISMAAQAHFSHKSLHGLNQDMLLYKLREEASVNWEDYPMSARGGVVTVKVAGERPVSFTDYRTGRQVETVAQRTWWESLDAPAFGLRDFLDANVPNPADMVEDANA